MSSDQATGPAPPIRGGRSRIPVNDITLAFTTVFAAALIALIAGFVIVPDVRPWLASPDGLVAWTSTATFGLAVGVALWAFGRSTPESRFRTLIPIAAVLLLLQSLRFGTGALNIRLPNVSGVEVGSLLDLRELTSVTASRLGLGYGIGLLFVLLLAIGTAWTAIAARKWARGQVRVTEGPVVAYLVAALGVEALIPLLGFFGDGESVWFVTMTAGLMGAGLLVVAGLAAGDHRTTVTGWRRRMWPWLADDGPLSGMPAEARLGPKMGAANPSR